MVTHSSTLAWKIPWAEEPGRLQSMGSQRVRHDWATSLSLFTFMPWRRKWQPTPVFSPGESQGWRSLVGCRLWGRTESDTTEVAAAAAAVMLSFFHIFLFSNFSICDSAYPLFNFWGCVRLLFNHHIYKYNSLHLLIPNSQCTPPPAPCLAASHAFCPLKTTEMSAGVTKSFPGAPPPLL